MGCCLEERESALASLPKAKHVKAKAITLFYKIPALSSYLIFLFPFLLSVLKKRT